jgi:hypothetical protein
VRGDARKGVPYRDTNSGHSRRPGNKARPFRFGDVAADRSMLSGTTTV